jgi:hypothetical protein
MRNVIAFVLLASPASADVVTVTPGTVAKLRDSIAINTHPDYGPGTFETGNAYQLYTPGYGAEPNEPVEHTWKKAVCDSGVKVLRANLKPESWSPYDFGVYQVNDLYRSCGIRWVLQMGDPPDYASNLRNLVDYDPGAVLAVEGPNEVDSMYWGRCGCSIATWAQQVRDEARNAHDWLAAHGYGSLKIIAPSFVKSGPGPGPGGYVEQPDPYDVGDLSAWVDYGNIHPYAGGLDARGRVSAARPIPSATCTGRRSPLPASRSGSRNGATTPERRTRRRIPASTRPRRPAT